MRRWYRTAVIGALIGLLVALGVAPTPASAQSGPSPWGEAEEQEFIRLINDLRSSRGLPPLAIDLELTYQSRLWAEAMKGQGSISHAPDISVGITSNWTRVGENVGVGGTVQALFDAFVASPGHFENLVHPEYRFIGVGVIWDGARMFTTHRFMAVAPPKAPAPALPAPAPTSPEPSQPAPPAPSPVPAPSPGPAPSPEPAAPAPVGAAERGDAVHPGVVRLDARRVGAVLDQLSRFGSS